MKAASTRTFVATVLFTGIYLSLAASQASADVGPPAKISMIPAILPAVDGVEYRGVFTIDVRKPGTLSGISLSGEGWNVIELDVAPGPQQVDVGVFRVPFRAIPTNADSRLSLTMSFDGQRVTRSLSVGSEIFARRLMGNRLRQLTPATSLTEISSPAPLASADASSAAGSEALLGCQTLRFQGRIVYERPSAIDNTCNNPTSFTLEGVDGIKVEVVDEDPVFDEVIWSGFTNPDGTFDSGMISWDDCDIGCSVGCDTPDIYLRYECDTGVVNVQDGDDIFEGDWTWDNSANVIADWGGTSHDFGTHMPANSAQMPALHMHNSITRAHRFLNDRGIANLPEVDVLWPWGTNAFYDSTEPEINISPSRQWNEGTHIHEYGHHYMENESFSQPPNYCNGFCDGNTACTSGTACENVGHCGGCPENPADAWLEGFPSWMADAIIRSWEQEYQLSDGSPWVALSACGRSQETPQSCCQDQLLYGGSNVLITETFVGALLRDIEDGVAINGIGLQDDHNSDGIFDSLCLGVGEIFSIVSGGSPPQSLQDFVNQFYNNFPQHRTAFWKTAVNIDPVLVAGLYPADTLPPDAVTVLDSSTHPIGIGGRSSCVAIEWEPPTDDVSGACAYSYTWVADPTMAVPDMTANLVDFSGCLPTANLEHYGLGQYYFGIRAQDCGGMWGPHQVFGPFEINECNGNGILDVCDFTCDGSELDFSGKCVAGMPPNACSVLGCGTQEDCNGNLVPDGCDIVDGFSEDCDIDGVPDECQAMKHWAGTVSSDWGDGGNWVEMTIPVFGDIVCIPVNAQNAPVTYQEDDTLLTSMSSRANVSIASNSPSPDLRLVVNSFVLGDFSMSGTSTNLIVDDRFYIDGLFTLSSGRINGPGVTEVNGGFDLTQSSANIIGGELKLTGGQGVSDGPRLTLTSGANVTIGPSATYTYTGGSAIFDGGSGLINVEGTLNSSATDGSVSVMSPVNNSGVIRTQVDELVLTRGGTHTGQLLGDLGTNMRLHGNGGDTSELLATSSIVVDNLELSGGTGNIRGMVNITDTLEIFNGNWTFQPEANIVSYGAHLIGTNGTHRFLAPIGAPIAFDTVSLGPASQGGLSVYFDTGQPVNAGQFDLNKGFIYGSSPINVSGAFSWTNGNIAAGGAITANGPAVIKATSSSRSLARTLNITDQAMVNAGFGMSGSGVVNNINPAVFNLQFNNGGIGAGTFNNFGTILRSSGTGAISISAQMNNSGLIHNQTGTLSLSGGGTYDGVVRGDPGTLMQFGSGTDFLPTSSLMADDVSLTGFNSFFRGTVDISGVMTIDSGPNTFTNVANIINYGTDLIVNPGQVVFEAPTNAPIVFDTITFNTGQGGITANFNTGQPVNVNTLTNLKGTVMGSSPINVANSFVWTGGNFFPGGTVTLNGSSVVNVTSSARTMSRHVNNAGNFTMLGGFSMGSGRRITNLATGVFDMQGDDTSLSGGEFLNQGMFLRSSGNVSSDFLFHNFVNTGTVDIQTNRMNMQQSSYTQTAGQTILSGGDFLMVLPNAPMTIDGGMLMGIGMISANVANNGGVTAPGLSAGELTIMGDYTQGAGATLDIEIGGTNAGEFDVLTVSGTASLAGELLITDLAGFTPLSGDTLVILTAASVTGTFDTLTIPSHYAVVYNATDVTIQQIMSSPSPDLNGDGLVDLKDYALFLSCYAGAGQAPSAGCAAGVDADLDMDGDVDQDDYEIFYAAITP